jgi:Tol biopolymer transport system component
VSLYLCTASHDHNDYLRLRDVLYNADAKTYRG